MRLCLFLAALVTIVAVTECKHTFMGTNVQRQRVFHRNVKFEGYTYQKRIKKVKFSMPHKFADRTIQGILAYDKIRSGASVNVTQGGLGFNFVTLRMKSERGRDLNYDVYIYA